MHPKNFPFAWCRDILRLACRHVAAGGLLLLASAGFARAASAGAAPATQPFCLETLVDFMDDASTNGRPLTAQDLDALMAKLADLGFTRVTWGCYGDGHGGWIYPEGLYNAEDGNGWNNVAETYRQLGNPLRVAVEAAHRHGLKIHAYFKPYETGAGPMFPDGSPEAAKWGVIQQVGGRMSVVEPFVRDHPELRIKRRTDDLPAWVETAVVARLRLMKKDASPTRITAEHLQVWTSPNNYRYQPVTTKFEVKESVEPAPQDACDLAGHVLTHKGDPVRVLTLSGLHLADRYVLVTTDFKDGTGDFTNSGVSLLAAFDEAGREIPGETATGQAIWDETEGNFRQGGLMYDSGLGPEPVTLDRDNANGRQGLIGFARGRNLYLTGAMCEMEPAVQEFWLRCLDEMIATGVDGVDFREECHSTHTDHPLDYGFNDIVLAKARARGGDLLEAVSAVRGEAYTEFLQKCRVRLTQAGKSMRQNLHVDFFRPDLAKDRRIAYPSNIRFDWPRWMDLGLMDGVILRTGALPFSALDNDPVALAMIAGAQAHKFPVTFNRYVRAAKGELTNEVLHLRNDGRFAGFVFYEVNDYAEFPKPGEVRLKYLPVPAALQAVQAK